MSIIDELGLIAIASRLKRLSDTFLKDAALIYKKHNAQFLTKWYPVINSLNRKSPLSLAEIATELSYAHPSVIELINEMEAEGLVRSSPDKKDGRKRMVSLTPKSKKVMREIQPYVDAFIEVLKELMNSRNNLMKALEEVEGQLKEKSFFARVDAVLKLKMNKRA